MCCRISIWRRQCSERSRYVNSLVSLLINFPLTSALSNVRADGDRRRRRVPETKFPKRTSSSCCCCGRRWSCCCDQCGSKHGDRERSRGGSGCRQCRRQRRAPTAPVPAPRSLCASYSPSLVCLCVGRRRRCSRRWVGPVRPVVTRALRVCRPRSPWTLPTAAPPHRRSALRPSNRRR